ncbi:MAG: 2OG-Fe(II) oxygenase family protein [Sideroxydans sp.]|nr:2OG-Fe(II) oxygenase family protein [Sideroxydans sp.]
MDNQNFSSGNFDIDPSLVPLAKWINPQHLQTGAVLACHQSLESHPLSLVVLDDFLLPGVADRISNFLKQEAEYKRVFQNRSKEYLNEQQWNVLPKSEQFYRFLTLKRVKPSCLMSQNWLTFLAFSEIFKTPAYFSLMEAVSGMKFSDAKPAGIHGHEVNDVLDWHADAGRNKDFCGVLYLSPDWTCEDGGELEIRCKSENNFLLTPVFNRLVLFKTTNQAVHRVRPHAPSAANKVRYCHVCWFKK